MEREKNWIERGKRAGERGAKRVRERQAKRERERGKEWIKQLSFSQHLYLRHIHNNNIIQNIKLNI